MVLKLEDKKAIVTDLRAVFEASISAVAADYRGLTVAEMQELRVNARKAGVVVRVSRNTLAKRAIQETHFAGLNDSLSGPIVLLLSQDDPGACARVLRDYVKKHEKLDVKVLVVDGSLFGPERLKEIASLPTMDEALAQLLTVMQAPVVKYVRTLKETVAQLVRVIAAVRDKKEAA